MNNSQWIIYSANSPSLHVLFSSCRFFVRNIHPLWAGIAGECPCSCCYTRNAVEVPALSFRRSYCPPVTRKTRSVEMLGYSIPRFFTSKTEEENMPFSSDLSPSSPDLTGSNICAHSHCTIHYLSSCSFWLSFFWHINSLETPSPSRPQLLSAIALQFPASGHLLPD